MTGRVQTVLGDVAPEALGKTLIHEHLFSDMNVVSADVSGPVALAKKNAPVTSENLAWVRYHWHENSDNLRLHDEALAAEELQHYRLAGGGTIVDATMQDFGRDPEALQRLSRASGLHIVMGTGHYVSASHPPGMPDRDVDDVAAVMVRELTSGAGDAGPRAGIIGELGCSWPLDPDERKVLQAAALAQQETGAAINVHPGRDGESPREILDVLRTAGANLSRVIIGHVERTLMTEASRLELLDQGCFLAFDLFGWESSFYPPAPWIDMPNDGQRLNGMLALVNRGYAHQLLVSQDLSTKVRLKKFGGHGYGHILENVVPLMRVKGFDQTVIDCLLTDNPQRLLTLA